jgi:hypothetical protein
MMPMYYFRVEHGSHAAEPQGLRLRDIAEARNHARTLDDAIRQRGDVAGGPWAVIVTDEDGTVVYEIRPGP